MITTLKIVVAFVLCLAAVCGQPALPQTGAMMWEYVGWDSVLERYDWIQGMHFVPEQNHVIVAAKTSIGSPGVNSYGADIVVIDYTTGREIDRKALPCKLVSRDTIGERGEFTVTGMSMNDSGTVLCYKCRDEPWAVVHWPSMEPMNEIDTRGFAKEGSRLRISGDGRYYFINALGINIRINRTTGDTVVVPWCYDNGLDVSGSVGIGLGPSLVNIDSGKRILDTLGDNGRPKGISFSLARNGSRVLVSTELNLGFGIYGYHRVYDSRTGDLLWMVPRKERAGVCYITVDGDEVIVDEGIRYRLPETEPWAKTDPPKSTLGRENYQLLTRNEVLYFQKDDARVRRYRLDTSITSIEHTEVETTNTLLYPNPGRGRYTIQLNECISSQCEVTLYDVSGSLIESITATCTDGTIPFEIGTTTPGAYMIRVSLDNSQHKSIAMQFLFLY